MSQLLLKMIFYMTTGVIMASISWSTISHASVTGDYILAIILLGAMFFIVGMFIVDRCQPELSERDFHPTKPLKKASFCFFVGAPALGAPFVLIILFTISPFRNHISIDEGAIPAV